MFRRGSLLCLSLLVMSGLSGLSFAADLRAVSVQFVPTGATSAASDVVVGQSGSVVFTVSNEGTTRVMSIPVQVEIGGRPTTRSISIEAGRSATVSVSHTFDREGTVTLVGTANPGNRFTESNFDNNRVESSVVVSSTHADLRAVSIEFRLAGSGRPVCEVPVGQSGAVVLTVSNDGPTRMMAIPVRIEIGGRPTTRSVTMESGQSTTASVSHTFEREETVRLVGTANPGNRFTERYYDNNRVEQSIVVRPRE
jgi:subtilase family serine protease